MFQFFGLDVYAFGVIIEQTREPSSKSMLNEEGAILNILNVRCPRSSQSLDFWQQFEICLSLGVKLEGTFQIIFVFP